MEACLKQIKKRAPNRIVLLQSLADKFSASPERAGRVAIQPKQVWNWFQNRRYSHRAKSVRSPLPPPPSKMTPSAADRLQHATAFSALRAAQTPDGAHSSAAGKGAVEGVQVEFEAKSARDSAWYDVAAFLSHRTLGDLVFDTPRIIMFVLGMAFVFIGISLHAPDDSKADTKDGSNATQEQVIDTNST